MIQRICLNADKEGGIGEVATRDFDEMKRKVDRVVDEARRKMGWVVEGVRGEINSLKSELISKIMGVSS